MSAPFQPGDKVACVDARAGAWHEPKGQPLEIGDVFTVERFVRGLPFGLGFPRSFVVLRGRGRDLLHWDAYRFRKLVEQDDAALIARIKSVPTPSKRERVA